MTHNEHVQAIADEAVRRLPPFTTPDNVARLAASLALEGWGPKKRFEDAAREILKRNMQVGAVELVRLGIEYGASLPPKPVKPKIPMHLDGVVGLGFKDSTVKLRYCRKEDAGAAYCMIDRMLGLGGIR